MRKTLAVIGPSEPILQSLESSTMRDGDKTRERRFFAVNFSANISSIVRPDTGDEVAARQFESPTLKTNMSSKLVSGEWRKEGSNPQFAVFSDIAT